MTCRDDVIDRRPTGAKRVVLAAALIGAVAIGGCAKQFPEETGAIPTDGYRTQYPIAVTEGEVTLDIPVGFGSAGLSASMRDNVRSYAAEASVNATSTVAILTPTGSGNHKAATAIAREARAEVQRGGVPARMIEMRTYAVNDPTVAAPVRLSFSRIMATSPECGLWNGSVLSGGDNGDAVEFGCATQANFAAMVANPEDLIVPRASSPIPGGRRQVIWKKWMGGEATASAEEIQASETTGDN